MRAAIFPGQGSQEIGMGKDVADQFPVAAETFQQADELLGFELSRLCFDGPSERLNATDIQQPAIFTTSVAIYRAAIEAGVFRADTFEYMAGLSLGEYTALHLAGAMTFGDALRLVNRRGQLMQQAATESPGGMVSLMGMDETQAWALCGAARNKVDGSVPEPGVMANDRLTATVIGPANFNCPGQIVISGHKTACEAAVGLAEEYGGRAIPLDVAGAFHSELMRPAAIALHETLAATEIRAPRCKVVSNVDVALHADPDAIRHSLYQQVFSPIRWQACVEHMIAAGVGDFWEVGPKRVLTGLNRKIDRNAKTTNISKVGSLVAAEA
jgi:[acyl-carrier-protein] S-malonyltransferase